MSKFSDGFSAAIASDGFLRIEFTEKPINGDDIPVEVIVLPKEAAKGLVELLTHLLMKAN